MIYGLSNATALLTLSYNVGSFFHGLRLDGEDAEFLADKKCFKLALYAAKHSWLVEGGTNPHTVYRYPINSIDWPINVIKAFASEQTDTLVKHVKGRVG